MHLVDACMTSVQLEQGAVGHSGTQRYAKDASGSKLSFVGMVTRLVYSDQRYVPSITLLSVTVWH